MTVACSPETMPPFLLAVFSQVALTVSEWTLIGLVLNFLFMSHILLRRKLDGLERPLRRMKLERV